MQLPNRTPKLTTKLVVTAAGLLAAAGFALTGCADDGAATRDGGSVSGSGSGSGSGPGSASH